MLDGQQVTDQLVKAGSSGTCHKIQIVSMRDVPDGQGELDSSDPRPPSCTSASSDATLKAGVWDTSG